MYKREKINKQEYRHYIASSEKRRTRRIERTDCLIPMVYNAQDLKIKFNISGLKLRYL